MSIDHNYARGKLNLLLRDLSNYNAGEFWREMSRIASGATASIHAEGLKAERDALADSNTQLMQQNEAQIRMNAKLMHERDALAAHVERLTKAVDALTFGLVHDEKPSWKPGKATEDAYSDVMDLTMNTPETSLFKRDLVKQAEAVERLAKEFKEAWPDHNGKYAWILGATQELRQQAEDQQ